MATPCRAIGRRASETAPECEVGVSAPSLAVRGLDVRQGDRSRGPSRPTEEGTSEQIVERHGFTAVVPLM